MNSKQRSYLMSLAANQDAIFQVGKGGVSPTLVEGIDEALSTRELVKINVLKTSFEPLMQTADTIAGRTHSEVVSVIGRKIILYRPNPEKKNPIVLP